MKQIEFNPLQSFQEQVVDRSHSQPIVALLWGDNCAPCASLKPKLHALSNQQGFPLVVMKASLETMETVKELKVRTVPTVIVFNRGKEVTRFSGDKTETDLYTALAKAGTFQQPLSGV